VFGGVSEGVYETPELPGNSGFRYARLFRYLSRGERFALVPGRVVNDSRVGPGVRGDLIVLLFEAVEVDAGCSSDGSGSPTSEAIASGSLLRSVTVDIPEIRATDGLKIPDETRISHPVTLCWNE